MASTLSPLKTAGSPAALAAALAILIITPAFAQAQQGVQAPAQAQPPAAQGQQPQAAAPAEPPKQGWTKQCLEDAGSKSVLCITAQDLRNPNGQVIASTGLRELQGTSKREYFIFLPLGVKLKEGVKLQVDKGKQLALSFDSCTPQGCVAVTEVNDALLGQLKKGTQITVNAAIQNKGIQLPISLAGFKQAAEGPGLNLNKVAEQRKQLQEGLQKRAQEASQRLLQGGGTTQN
jgi:invasion protein IalB